VSIVSVGRARRFEELASSVAGALRRYELRRTDPDTAEDVVAETLLALSRRTRPQQAAGRARPNRITAVLRADSWGYGPDEKMLADWP
jgi:DNA-directed RNA polymerase specialized sigma24 family protein